MTPKEIPVISVGMATNKVIALLGQPRSRMSGGELLSQFGQVTAMGQGRGVRALTQREYWTFAHRAGLYQLIVVDGIVAEVHSQPWMQRKREFVGRSVEKAKGAATRALRGSESVETVVLQDVREDVVTGHGDTAERAEGFASKLVPTDAFDIRTREVTRRDLGGATPIQAHNEEEARRLSAGIGIVEDLECAVSPRKGLLGIGKKPGTWIVHWSGYNFEAEVSFKLPAIVSVTYYGKK